MTEAALRTVTFGGIDMPLRWSRARLPLIGTSTVTTRAVHPASFARRTNVVTISRLRHMYSWNQSGPDASAAISSIDQLDAVLMV